MSARTLSEPNLATMLDNWPYEYMRAAGRAVAERGLSADDGTMELAARVICDGGPKQGIGDRVAFLLFIGEQERAATERRIDLARHHIRRAVRPLFEAHATKADIEAEARRSSGDLPWCQVIPVLIDEAARMRSRRRRVA